MKKFYVVAKNYQSFLTVGERFYYVGDEKSIIDLQGAKRFSSHEEITQFLIEKGWTLKTDIFKIEEYYTL